jgi:hypothetical protein
MVLTGFPVLQGTIQPLPVSRAATSSLGAHCPLILGAQHPDLAWSKENEWVNQSVAKK